MVSLTIPDLIRTGLTKIANLSEESFTELVSAFERIPMRMRQHFIFEDAEIVTETIAPDDLKTIKNAVFPLYVGVASAAVPIRSYVGDLAQSLEEEGQEDTKWTTSEAILTRFKNRLEQLLSIKTLQTLAKAHDVLLEHAQTFSTARVLSDIRPAFTDGPNTPPESAVIVHMLNIFYYEAGRRKKFVVALDTKDVELLADALERAKNKTASLKAVIESSNMTYIEVV